MGEELTSKIAKIKELMLKFERTDQYSDDLWDFYGELRKEMGFE